MRFIPRHCDVLNVRLITPKCRQDHFINNTAPAGTAVQKTRGIHLGASYRTDFAGGYLQPDVGPWDIGAYVYQEFDLPQYLVPILCVTQD